MNNTNELQKNTNGRVIVTYGRSLMALTAVHSLGNRGVEIIGCDDVDMTVLKFSRHVEDYFLHAPYEDDVETYLNDMEENIRKFKPDDNRPYILMPMFRDAKILAKHRARFEGLITIAAPDYDAINKVNPKDVFANTCEELGLKIPHTRQTENFDELEKIKNDLEFPLLIKPADDVGGKGICKVENFDELKEKYENSIKYYDTPPLVQEVINGGDYCLSAICNNGKIVASMAYKNLYQFPRGSGAGIMRETIDDKPFVETAQKLLGALKWHGIAQIDFRWSGKKEESAYLIELNPRFWAGLFHSVESGVDFPWLLYQLAAFGHISDMSDVNIGAKTKIPGLWAVSALQDIAENETDFSALKEAWGEMWNKNNDESWRSRFQNLTQGLKDSIDSDDIQKKLKEMHEIGKSSKSELDIDNDPLTGLGALFVLSYLMRHGTLPPELDRER